ncbi:MAG: methionine synthase, partial [Gammaproteobacteria bacterium]|nr:methionine synthase [Gammaproteobacteria bacterium]
LKIEPFYQGNQTVWVKDASRAVGVAQNLISETKRDEFVQRIKDEYETVRIQHAGRKATAKWLSLENARKNKAKIEWPLIERPLPEPNDTKLIVFEDYSIEELIKFIDWTPFFHTWELKGSYPKIINDPEKGKEAKKLFDDAQAMLTQIVNHRWLKAKAVMKLFPANSVNDDDVEVYKDESRSEVLTTLNFLRQQQEKPRSGPNLCLADFVAPKTTELKDHVGVFAVTAGIGIEEHVQRFESQHDDYNSIMLKALADRLAESFAERLHQRVRTEFWGYMPEEELDNEALIRERYTGIRPAPGYPACPDHTEKQKLWDLLEVEKHTGIKLTEHFAMLPAASVSGIYFSHPDSQYFAVGKINRDQVDSYAKRKSMSLSEVERWLAPNLGYDS